MTFITFEGPEGAGKSTQIKRLRERLVDAGHNVTLTREPGGAPEAEALRGLLLDPEKTWSPLAEALLMNAARDAHWHATIAPALAAGEVVLCDRFFDSTRAYQHSVDAQTLHTIHKSVVPRLPDLTLLFDLPVSVGLERASARGAADRFENKGLDYHERVRATFLAIAEGETERFVIVDAAESVDRVTGAVVKAVHERLPRLLGAPHGSDPAP
ncbi:MAG: dTMP kinase [Pseudomonadota bacterium]